jgi:hypothetical protein
MNNKKATVQSQMNTDLPVREVVRITLFEVRLDIFMNSIHVLLDGSTLLEHFVLAASLGMKLLLGMLPGSLFRSQHD